MMNRIKSELLNFGLKFISIDEKIVRLFLETSPTNISEIVILPTTKIVMKKLVNKLKNKRNYGRVYNGELNNLKVSIIRSLIGCPNCAITIECLKRCKTKIVIRIDFCGGIESIGINIGDILIPKSAYCGDGTTPLYFLKYPALQNKFKSIPNPIREPIIGTLLKIEPILAKCLRPLEVNKPNLATVFAAAFPPTTAAVLVTTLPTPLDAIEVTP